MHITNPQFVCFNFLPIHIDSFAGAAVTVQIQMTIIRLSYKIAFLITCAIKKAAEGMPLAAFNSYTRTRVDRKCDAMICTLF